jgi:hypothetical protein
LGQLMRPGQQVRDANNSSCGSGAESFNQTQHDHVPLWVNTFVGVDSSSWWWAIDHPSNGWQQWLVTPLDFLFLDSSSRF